MNYLYVRHNEFYARSGKDGGFRETQIYMGALAFMRSSTRLLRLVSEYLASLMRLVDGNSGNLIV
jgi:hypothetical protein